MQLREEIYRLIEPRNRSTHASHVYDIVMLIAIIIGIWPLMFRTQIKLYWWFDLISGLCFIIDYILRWITADMHLKCKNWKAFFIYPFTFMAIVDLLSILPVLNILSPTFKAFRIPRLLKLLRIFKAIRYFVPLLIILSVVRKQSKILCTVLSLAIFYIFITALIMFNAEDDINPETGKFLFDNFFDAFYWAACTLTTVGYGDIYPISDTGRVISIISSMGGIAIIALPSGIITAGYMEELRNRKEKEQTGEEPTSDKYISRWY